MNFGPHNGRSLSPEQNKGAVKTPPTIYKGSSSDSSSVFYIRFFLDDVEIQTNLLKNPNKGGG